MVFIGLRFLVKGLGTNIDTRATQAVSYEAAHQEDLNGCLK